MAESNTGQVQRILVLLIGFGNPTELANYLNQVDAATRLENQTIDIVVVVNKGVPEDFAELGSGLLRTGYFVLSPGSNLGYLPGCSYGLDWYKQNHAMPDWVVVSNTDLTIPSDLFSITRHATKEVGQASPVVEDSDGSQQNPHLITRPTIQRMRILRAVHYFSFIGAAYIWASSHRKQSRRRPVLASAELELYSAHGSIFFLSRKFFESGGTISGSPMLYSEELFIGEQLRKLGLKSICYRNYRVLHESHAQTGLLGARAKSRLTRDANRQIFDRFYS